MKNTFTVIVLLLGFQFVNAQEFQESSQYIVSINGEITKQEYESINASLHAQTETTIALTSFPMEASETLETIKVSELVHPGLDGVSKVLKIDAKYKEYCAYVVSHYILVTAHGDYISLPKIGNTVCNDSTTVVKYLFPSQEFGKENQIVRSEIEFSEETNVSEVTTQESYIWNDDDFGTSAALSENF